MIERLDNIFQSNWVMQENNKMVSRGRESYKIKSSKTKQQTDIKKIIKEK